MSRQSTCLIAIAAGLLFAIPAAAQQKDLTYNAVAPCYVANTFAAGGPFAANETRVYNVVGSGSLAGQGGSASGCGIPGFSGGIARVQAVALTVLVVNPAGAGHVWAIAADTAIDPSATPPFMNFNAPPPGVCCLSVTNEAPVAVAQASGVGDIKINVAVSGAHLVVSVVGYYTRFGETILVGPGATPAASGTALLNALTSIADNSAAKPYLIKLEPGVYDVGDNRLQMKSFVDIEGSGRTVTTIQGAGNLSGVSSTGVVVGASSAELRNLSLKGVGSGSRPFVIPLFNNSSSPTVRDVAIVSSGGTNHWGIRNLAASPTVEDVTISVTATGNTTYGISNNSTSSPKIRRTEINVTSSASGETTGIFWDGFGVAVELRELRIDVSGTSVAYGVRQSGTGGIVLTVEDSTINAQTASTTYGVSIQSGSLFASRSKIRGLGAGGTGIHSPVFASATVDHSEVAGDVATVAIGVAQIGATLLDGGAAFGTCAGVYDENYTFFASTCP
jgi:hypothetical protein